MSKKAIQQKQKLPDDRILELIDWIEERKTEIIKPFDALDHTFWIITIVFIVIALITSSTIHEYAISIGIGIAGFSGLIAYYSFFMDTVNNRILEKRYDRVKTKKKFDETETVLIRALIKIKSKNDDISLKTLYMMDKEAKGDTFTEKRLIEILCK